jgi:2-dehydropantoate 2-reductase
MHIVVIGAGGVGGYFGTRLGLAGHDVTFLARGAHLSAIRRGDLRIETDSGTVHFPDAFAVDSLDDVPVADLVVIAVKLWDTRAASEAALSVMGPRSAAVSFQNGVDAMDDLARVVGQERVFGGVAYVLASIVEPGVIRRTGPMQKLVFGERDGRSTPRTAAFAEACQAASIDVAVSEDIKRAIWEKFVFIVGLTAGTCLFRRSVGEILSDPGVREFVRRLMDETVRVATATGVQLDASYADDRITFMRTLPRDMVTSMYVDMQRGRRLELPWFSGRVVEMGARLGIPTPANALAVDVLSLDERGDNQNLNE